MNETDPAPGSKTRVHNPVSQDDSGPASSSINLVLIYTLVALALAAAIGFAIMIVLPFYNRR